MTRVLRRTSVMEGGDRFAWAVALGNSRISDRPVRVVSTQVGGQPGVDRYTISVAETLIKRSTLTREIVLAMLAPQFEEELRQEKTDENFVERVRFAIQEKLTGRRPTIDDIAGALHISSRTLQRRLQEEGSSFQRVLDEARLIALLSGETDLRVMTGQMIAAALARGSKDNCTAVVARYIAPAQPTNL